MKKTIFRFDSELLLYEPYFKKIDSNPLVKNFTYQVTIGQAGENIPIPKKEIDKILADLPHKNGFVMAAYELNVLRGQFEEMKSMCQEIIELISKEIQ